MPPAPCFQELPSLLCNRDDMSFAEQVDRHLADLRRQLCTAHYTAMAGLQAEFEKLQRPECTFLGCGLLADEPQQVAASSKQWTFHESGGKLADPWKDCGASLPCSPNGRSSTGAKLHYSHSELSSTSAKTGGEAEAASEVDRKLIEVWPCWRKDPTHGITDTLWDKAKRGSPIKNTVSNTKLVQMLAKPEMRAPWYIILPSSNRFLFWNVLFMTVLFYDCVSFPLTAFELDELLRPPNMAAASFWTIDFFVSFFVAYNIQGHIETRLYVIVRTYITTWMFPDLLVVVVDWMLLLQLDNAALDSASFTRVGKAVRYLRVMRVLRVLRIRKVSDAINKIDEFMNSQYFSILKRIALNMVWILLLSHFIGCSWYALGMEKGLGETWIKHYGIDEYSTSYRYLTSVHWAIAQFTPGSVMVQPKNSTERLFAVTVLILGMIVFSSTVSSITAAANSLKNIDAKYEEELWLLRRFFREQKISRELNGRVLRYAESILKPKYQHVNLKDVTMLKALPTSLSKDVNVEIYKDHILVHPLFAVLGSNNTAFMQELCCKSLKEVMLDKAENLFSAGQVCKCMYFVSEGRLGYIFGQAEKDNIVSVAKSDSFCEAVLWTAWVHQGKMISATESHVMALDATLFQDVALNWDTDMLRKYATEFVYKMNELAGYFTERTDDDVDLSDLLRIDSAIQQLPIVQHAE